MCRVYFDIALGGPPVATIYFFVEDVAAVNISQ